MNRKIFCFVVYHYIIFIYCSENPSENEPKFGISQSNYNEVSSGVNKYTETSTSSEKYGESVGPKYFESYPNDLSRNFQGHQDSSHTDSLKNYDTNWSSLDSRPLPRWYDKAKIGIFIHWGVYSVPSFGSEWFWMHWKGNPSPNTNAQIRISAFMNSSYPPGFTYQEFASQFKAEFFDPAEWASIIEASGAKYVVITSKHHDGYTLWPSKYSYSWNSVDIGPHRDLIGELARAIRIKTNIKFGLYYSLYEWFHPLYLFDKSTNFTSQMFVNNKMLPELVELVKKYEPEVIWTDGEWEAPSKYWRAENFIAWLYNKSPVKETIVINDRWGQETLCKHGGYLTCADGYTPGTLVRRKWENAMPIDKTSWGYNRLSNVNDYHTTQAMIDILVETVAYGGNILLNIGPTKSGKITPIYQERLIDIGKWLKINGEAIYETTPWSICQKETNPVPIWYTTKNSENDIYIIILRWPKTNTIYLSCIKTIEDSKITFLGLPNTSIQGSIADNGLLKIQLPDKALIETNWGWVIHLEYLN